ncbi:MAG: hypothetical protein LW854_11725 [Rubrivivax sp.]|nr:hypothetical protein [Rubrivivax sp.]
MKHLRMVIMVLLALLLPIRGAMAAAMLCPADGSSPSTAAAVEQDLIAMPAEHGSHDAQAIAHHHLSCVDVSRDDSSVSDDHPTACQVCASACCLTPLAFAPPSVQASVLSTSDFWPALSQAIRAFESGGQDRPPRTT